MIRVGVVGAAGRMGRTTCMAVQEADDLELTCAIDPAAAGQDLSELLDGPSPALAVTDGLESLEHASVDVVVDFTVATGIAERLEYYAAHDLHAVVGTSGIPASVLDRARELFAGGTANAVIAAQLRARRRPPHPVLRAGRPGHGRRRDRRAPPRRQGRRPLGHGVAHRRADRAARQESGAGPFNDDPTTEMNLDGARGGLGPMGIRVHAVRLPGLVAHEEVIFGAASQILTIRHDSFDRRSFMPGVLLAIRQVAGRPGLTVGLGALLDP